MADLNPDSLNKLRVIDLREHLSSRGLPTSGLKADLVKRLREAILNPQHESEDNSESLAPKEERMDVDEKSAQDESTDEGDHIESAEMEEGNSAEEDEARLKAEEEARLQAEEEARRQAEEEARRQAEEEARRQAEEEARRQAEEVARLQAEEEARLRAEEKAKLKAKEEARLQAEEEARLKAQEEARLRAVEEEARLQAEEKARLRAAEEEARRRAEEEEARLEAEEKARIRHEKARLIAKEEEEAKLKSEEDARRRAEEERRRRAEEKAKIKAEADERMRVAEEQRINELKRIAEEEMRIEQERWLVEEQMRRAQEEHKMRIKAEEQKRLLEEEKMKAEKQKRLKEQQKKFEEEQQKKFEEERQKKFEEERQKKFEEERKKKFEEERKKKFEEEQQKKFEEEQQKKFEEEQQRKFEEEQQKKAAEQQRRLQEEERLKRIEEQKQFLADEEQKMSQEEIKLPQAIEKVLALKSERAQLLGVDPEAVVQPVTTGDDKGPSQKSAAVTLVSVDEDEGYIDDDDVVTKTKESKSRRRKKKKKKRSSRVQEKTSRSPERPTETTSDVDVEYVQEVIDISDPLYSQFMKIFDRFKLTDGEKEKEDTPMDVVKDSAKEENINPMALRKKPMDLDDDDDDEKDDDDKIEEEKPKLSKRKLKKLSRMTVAELKQKVNRPELVEMHDVTAKDPVLLLHLKASRNTVPVPRHWCFKRKYLQGKRGIEKPAFELPDFIKKTGIMEMRQALQEKEDQKTMKAKMRERVRPKLGKIDIDYQKLHDAFFKWQTKPKMTIHGDLYYEGKEFETRLKEKKPGDLSEDLRTALGMPTGPNAHKCPPPWLIAMQRYGPPPSYPNLKIPGLNAPIPEDCSFGYHAGGWGKPPVDETGRPLYGDVFGTQIAENQPNIQEEEIDHTLWGELESESSEEEEDEDEEDEDEEEEKAEDESGLVTPAEGLITPSGFSSIPAGMETPDMIELRKRKIESEIEGGETPALYTILPEKKGERVGAAMMGSTHIYDLAAAIPAGKLRMPGTSSVPPQGIEVALDPSELEMDSAAMAARYEQTMREQQSQLEKEDLSDMVAEHAARQKNKRKKQQLTSAKPPKKYKEFKF